MTDETAKEGEINGDALDRFTFAHFGVGVAFGLAGAPWWLVIAGALGWELIERPLKREYPGAFPHPSQDTVPNAIVDVGAVLAGAALVKMWKRK